MATYFIDTAGTDDAGRDGSISQPWATLAYAVTRVTAFRDIIHINAGTYNSSGQIEVPNGVSIEGAGRDLVTMILTYNSSYPCIKLETPSGWGNTTYGNQSISGIKFDGDLTGIYAIGINFRSNVHVYNCEFIDFDQGAIFFNGQPEWVWSLDNPYNDNPNSDYPYIPNSNGWCTGNKFYNNIVTNCARYVTSDHHSGAVNIGTQDGFEAYGNNINSFARHGYGIKFWNLGFNKNSDIHNNTIEVYPLLNGVRFEFAIELWWELGGTRIYNNRLKGALDLVNCVDTISAGYSVRVHNNNIGRDSTPASLERGILLEGRCEYVQIYQNYLHHLAIGIYVPRNNYTYVDRLYHIDIYDNLIVKLGQTETDWQTWGIYYPDFIDEAEHQYVKIQNNVFEADDSLSTISMFGVQLPNVTKQSYIYVDNNIILNFYYASIYAGGSRTKATNIYIRNNISYNNGNSNNPLFTDSFPIAGVVETSTIKQNPLFVGGVEDSYKLSSISSPAYHTGIQVTFPNGTVDYENKAWNNPPSIGAYEYGVISSKYLQGNITFRFSTPNSQSVYFLECVPDTDTFTLDNVCHVINPAINSLVNCFAEAIAEYYDPMYEGVHDRLSNFRNYCIHRIYEHIYSGDSSDACIITFSESATLTAQMRLYGSSSIVFSQSGTGSCISSNGLLYGSSSIIFSQNGNLINKISSSNIKYGALYNWYVTTDARNICAAGWHIPSKTEFETLAAFIGGGAQAYSYQLRETGDTYWLDNILATNEFGFNGRGSGYRDVNTGLFDYLNIFADFWTNETYPGDPNWAYDCWLVSGDQGFGDIYFSPKKTGYSLRPVRAATEAEQLLDDGTACDPYIGNDLKQYRTVKIGTQVWVADNLAETKYRDGSDIPEIADNAAWAALTTGAYCWYNNDPNNGCEEIAVSQIRTATGISLITFVSIGNMLPSIFPNGLNITQPTAGDHLYPKWNEVTGITGYVLQRAPNWYSNDGGVTYYWAWFWKTIYVGVNSWFIDDIQEEGIAEDEMQVDYRVAVYNGVDAGPFSDIVSFNWQDV